MSAAEQLEREALIRFATDRPECFDMLSDRERAVAIARWTECPFQRKTLEELGKEYGVTRERIRQIEESALKKVRLLKRRDVRKCERCDGRGWV